MLPSAALLAIATFFIILGHDGRRVAQLLVLFLPAVLWMAWPVRTAGMRQLRRVAVVLLTLAFAADGMVRAYLMETYQSAPDSATVLGALWAAEAWGGYWSWDPKETWALIVWLNYAAWLHMRLMKGLRGTVSAWWALVGLAVTTFAFLGVNMFLSGLHSYGEL
jgi:ABC-type transport system involved in cytochrome c biogenesis permease subunit